MMPRAYATSAQDTLNALFANRISVMQAQQELIDLGIPCKFANDLILGSIRFPAKADL